jgi:hypothetical protein
MTAWRDEALCLQTDPELFFDESPDGVEAAKAICAACTVREPDCLANALTNGNSHGVQAGLTADERREHPGFTAAAPASDFAPPTDDELARRWAANQRRLERRAQAEARRRDQTRTPFDQLVHPFDRKARS